MSHKIGIAVDLRGIDEGKYLKIWEGLKAIGCDATLHGWKDGVAVVWVPEETVTGHCYGGAVFSGERGLEWLFARVRDVVTGDVK